MQSRRSPSHARDAALDALRERVQEPHSGTDAPGLPPLEGHHSPGARQPPIRPPDSSGPVFGRTTAVLPNRRPTAGATARTLRGLGSALFCAIPGRIARGHGPPDHRRRRGRGPATRVARIARQEFVELRWRPHHPSEPSRQQIEATDPVARDERGRVSDDAHRRSPSDRRRPRQRSAGRH